MIRSPMLIAVLTTALVAPAGRAQEGPIRSGPSLVKTLPEATTFLLHVRDTAKLVADFKATPLYALREQEGFAQLFTTLTVEVEALRQQALAEAKVDAAAMLQAVEGDVVLALGDIGPLMSSLSEAALNMERPQPTGDMVPLVLALETGAGRAQFKENLLALFAYLVKNGAGVRTDDFHSGKLTTLTVPEGATGDFPAFYLAELGSTYLFSPSKLFLDGMARQLKGEAAGESLTGAAEFKATAELAGKDSDIFLFLNVEQLVGAIQQALQATPFVLFWQPVQEILFGDSLHNVGVGYSLDPDSLRSRTLIHTGGAGSGIVGWFKGKPFAPGVPGYVSEKTVTYMTTAIDPEAIGRAARKFAEFAQSMNALQGGQPTDFEKMFESEVGVSFDAVLKSLGDRLHYWLDDTPTTPANPLGGFTLVLELKDEATWKKLLSQAAEKSRGEIERRAQDGEEIYSVRAPDGSGFSLAFTASAGRLILTARPDGLQEILGKLQEPASPLAKTPAFRKAVEDVPAQVTGFVYTSPEYGTSFAGSLKGMVPPHALAEGGLPVEVLELLAAAARTMGASVGYSVWNDHGLYCESSMLFKK